MHIYQFKTTDGRLFNCIAENKNQKQRLYNIITQGVERGEIIEQQSYLAIPYGVHSVGAIENIFTN